ncbi:stalk domain-containing protein [Cohnella faecalis]|uniref:Copper amine oxidase-like N-terminal domain-containing protein n=1 Tax=Cohnella faecalis TaxID=2315694 RepID=A0A398CRQ0_9BACL|nr:hypothetical protein [Cohnella faecalis]RIE03468.1 hypothetical protein D3H35_12485 [Cohnella faecalis]
MNKKKAILIATVAGVIATTASVGASGILEKVSGLVRKDYQISVNGEKTSLTPVFINGQAYLPVRSAAAALGYELQFDGANKEIDLTERSKEEAADYMRMNGVIVTAQPVDNGQYRIELLGRGDSNWIILYVDDKTALTDAEGKAVAAKDLKPGMQATAEFGPVVALSYPGQSHAAKLSIGAERLIKEDVIQSVKHTDDGWQVQFGESKDGAAVPTLILNAGKETSVLTAEGQSVAFEDLKAGDRVRAYYGPIMTKSIPPISPLYYLVLLAPDNGQQIAPAEAQQFRDLAWNQLSDDQKTHLTTARNDAVVDVVSAKESGVFPSDDAQKKKLEELKAANAKLVTVTYHTDQDALLGPLTAAFSLETKEFIGYYIRK